MENEAKVIKGIEKVPDYQHLFEEKQTEKGKKKKNFLGKLLKINAKPMVGQSLMLIFQNLPIWFLPLITSYIINIAVETLDAGTVDWFFWRKLIISSAILIFILVINVPITILRWRVISNMTRRTSAGVKSAVIRKLQSLSITYHKDMQTGKIQSKFIKDTESIDGLFSQIIHGFLPCILNAVVSIGLAIINNGFVSLFFLLIIPCDVALTLAFRKRIRKTNREYRIKAEKMSAKLNTMLEMMPVTKSHGLEDEEIKQVDDTIKQLAGSGKKVDMTIANFGSWTYVVPTMLSVVCLIFCVALAIFGYIKVGDIVLYQSLFSTISNSITAIISLVPTIATGIEALNSVSEIMNATDVEVNIGKKSVPSIEGQVEFKKVSYRYPNSDQYVVKDFSLSVKSGECIAVVGASGSGKTTIMNLIIGFLKIQEGQLLIDGKSINDFNLSEYRHHISVVPQSSILFPGSIRENITYGLSGYTEEQLFEVIKMANLVDLIKELPNGIETDVGEHGGKLSGGQRQRITIARALIRNPKILILDEATSALDNISEYHVQKAISSSIKGRTTFIVAHRLSTIRDADRIVVMENGYPVEIGSYEELMEKKGKFFKLKKLNELNLKEAQENLE